MKRLCYEIITIILTHAFILSGPALAISNRDLQQPQDAPRVQGKQDCLGPEILLPIARFENIFKNGYVSWENKIYDVLNAWLVKNHVISERLRLDDIEQKVGQDINYLTARAEEVEKKARALIALCRETPSRANYKKLLNFFKDTPYFFLEF